MLFTSIVFLVFFLPLCFAVYYFIPNSIKNEWILLASVAFYAWGAPTFVLVLLASSLLDFILVKNHLKFKPAITIGIISNLLLLGYFKYANFFVEQFTALFGAIGFHFGTIEKIILPLGISFFTFQKISFLIDVKRKDAETPKRFHEYLIYVMLFPQLIAGPIIRYKEVSSQIKNRLNTKNWQSRYSGFMRFIVGLSKKLLIADLLAPVATSAFNNPADVGVATIGLLAFTFQIYFDFSGYSDMAIGLGKMLDFKFPENFNFPYTAKGFQSFWRKWHISLSRWMRDYLYIPLGGNQSNKARTSLNLWIVFLLSGFWHGASFNFILWGAWHGLFITLDKTISFPKLTTKWLSVPITFVLVALGWVWFRASDLSSALDYFRAFTNWNEFTFELSFKQSIILTIAFATSFAPARLQSFFGQFYESVQTRFWMKSAIVAVMLILCLGAIATSGEQPFIYFRF